MVCVADSNTNSEILGSLVGFLIDRLPEEYRSSSKISIGIRLTNVDRVSSRSICTIPLQQYRPLTPDASLICQYLLCPFTMCLVSDDFSTILPFVCADDNQIVGLLVLDWAVRDLPWRATVLAEQILFVGLLALCFF